MSSLATHDAFLKNRQRSRMRHPQAMVNWDIIGISAQFWKMLGKATHWVFTFRYAHENNAFLEADIEFKQVNGAYFHGSLSSLVQSDACDMHQFSH